VAPIGPLRGRGGSEWAIGTHAAGDDFVLLDDHIITLDPRIVGDAASASIAAIGSGDEAAVSTPIAGAGTSRPLAPVHGVVRQSGTGGLTLTWVRRARGAWGWHDAVDVPLNEDEERWTIGYGDAATPAVRWETGVAMLDLSSAQAESPSRRTRRANSISARAGAPRSPGRSPFSYRTETPFPLRSEHDHDRPDKFRVHNGSI
jgi:hypothetical protein